MKGRWNMKLKTDYTQCKLTKYDFVELAWIPSQFAKLGKVIKLKICGIWNDGWKVSEIHGKVSQDKIDKYYSQNKDIAFRLPS